MAAKHVGCCCKTIHNTANRDPKFRRQLDQTQVSPELTFLKTVHAAGQEKWQAARWALQHMYPDRYARKARTIPVADVKLILSQLIATVRNAIADRKIRAAVLKRLRAVAAVEIRKAQNPRARRAR